MFLTEQCVHIPGHIPGRDCVNCNRKAQCLPESLLPAVREGTVLPVAGNLRLPKRAAESHKGDYGKLLLLGGSVGYTGAPSLCARAAVRSGAGLVSLGVPEMIYPITAVKNDEAMPFPLPCDGEGRFSPAAADKLSDRLSNADVAAAGPGMGRGEGTRAVTRWLLENATGPLLLDADALWALSTMEDMPRTSRAQVVLTPHEGEFARLWPGRSGNRLEDARRYADDRGCCLVLKGHRTLVAFPGGNCYVIAAGNPGMATGGSGDVLSGVIAAMLGQLDFERAVVTACWLHARAGDLAAAALGEYALCASDIIDFLPNAEKEITQK